MVSTKRETSQRGSILIYEVVVIFIFSLAFLALLSVSVLQLRVLRSVVHKEQAFQIAEAGVNYYQWHLAHFTTDYADGSGQAGCSPCGPYVHDYVDMSTNQVIGRYSLSITPPAVGSTVTTIASTGWTLANPNTKRTVTVRYGIPSLARYAFLTHSDVWVGSTESINGSMHANGGIRFDGTGNAPITSAKSVYPPSPGGYQCQTYHGCSFPYETKPGIWGSAPASTQTYWRMGQPNFDFSSMTSDLATLKALAQDNGIYYAPSNTQGYSLVFNNNNTVSVYKVNSLRSHATGWDVNGAAHNEDLDYNARTLQSTHALPTNGIIFIEDRAWVEGTVSGRVMVAAGKLPYNATTAPSIIIPNNLVYTVKDGSVSLGLLAQKDILISYFAPNTLEINAAMVAQNGSTQYFYFPGNLKNSISIFGSLASFGVWTWSWVNGGGAVISGYQSTTTVYDSNLLYAPPPSFPLSSSGYEQITWSSN